MRLRHPSLLAACSLLSFFSAQADVVVLKNGENIVGTIVREDDEKYVVEVNVTGTIRDEKTIARADVVRIERQPEDEKAFLKLAGLAPAPELLPVEGYEERIAQLEGFLKEYPDSSNAAKAKELIESLKEELAVISAGGIKFGEGIIPADEYEANAYEYDARIAEKKIRDAASRRDMLGALRMFDEYEARFGQPVGRDGLASLMLQVLAAYGASIADNLASLDSRLSERESGLSRMAPDDRARSERALKEQMDELTERFNEEKSSRMKWVTPHAFHKESLDEAQRQVTAEVARLGKEAPAPETPLAEVYRSAWEKLLGGTDEQKNAVIEEAKANKLPEYYLTKLRERAGLPVE